MAQYRRAKRRRFAGKFRVLLAVLGGLSLLLGVLFAGVAGFEGRAADDLAWRLSAGYAMAGFVMLIARILLIRRREDRGRGDRRRPTTVRSMRRRGSVLVMALLFTGMLAALALYLHAASRMDTAASERRWFDARLRVALVDEVFSAARALAVDRSPQVDHLQEPWASEWIQQRPDGVTVRIRITDLNRYIDLNNVVLDGSFPEQSEMERILSEAMRRSGDEAPAERLRALIGWIRPDLEEAFGEALYRNLDPPYQPAARWLDTWGDLLWVHGFGPEYFEHESEATPLAPEPPRFVELVAIIPGARSRPTRINLNTACEEVLEIVLGPGQEPVVRRLISEREDRPIRSVDVLMTQLEPARFLALRPLLDVRSTHFQIDVEAQRAAATRALSALVHRSEDGAVKMLQWAW